MFSHWGPLALTPQVQFIGLVWTQRFNTPVRVACLVPSTIHLSILSIHCTSTSTMQHWGQNGHTAAHFFVGGHGGFHTSSASNKEGGCCISILSTELHGRYWSRIGAQMVVYASPKFIVIKWTPLSLDVFYTSAETCWTAVNINKRSLSDGTSGFFFFFVRTGGLQNGALHIAAYCSGMCTHTSVL